MKRALIIANTASMVHLFNEANIVLLQSRGYEVHVACNFLQGNTISDAAVEECRASWLERGIICHHIDFLRTPFSFRSFGIYRRVKHLLRDIGFDLIHCHTPIVSSLTRLAARKMRRHGTRVIYTAHGFHFYSGAPLKNWLMFFTMEWLCSFHTDVLITINEEDYRRACRRFHAVRTEYIPGVGIDCLSIRDVRPDKRGYMAQLGVTDQPVLISVGELNDNKNHAVILRAIAMLKAPCHYIICGRGDGEQKLRDLANELGISDKVSMVGFRSDVKELLACADIFCFPSYREGLSVAMMEAMASGLPVVASNIRGNTDLITDCMGGILCPPDDTQAFAAAINTLATNIALRKAYGRYNLSRIRQFSLDIVSDKLSVLYFEDAEEPICV